jgi:ribosomal protein L11 methyltransferase
MARSKPLARSKTPAASPSTKQVRYTWRKLSASKWEDVWPERLSEFTDRLAITSLANRKTLRVEIFELNKSDADRLSAQFGGSVSKQSRDWLKPAGKPRPPLNIRGKLEVVTNASEGANRKPTLVIPAGMAFGTGEHATTLNCLRFIADFAGTQQGPWELLDLGCGTGILALAARKLGAAKVFAGDFDPDCVTATKQNAQLNELSGVTIRRLDVFQWEPDRTWPIVTANLYSTILIAIAPKLARAVAPAGTLIFSGVMRDQEQEVTAALRKVGLPCTEVKRQGKWVAGVCKRVAPAERRRKRST